MQVVAKSLGEQSKPCSKVMAGQDFRWTIQKDVEMVLSRETKDAMLQEGLQVSDKEFCMVAKMKILSVTYV